MTLKEIAALAGVSPSTVSRVINHPGSKAASKEVENRIWKIIRETGYTPDTSARNLKLRSAPFQTPPVPRLSAASSPVPIPPTRFFQDYPRVGKGSFAQRLYRKIYFLLSGY